jgi:uncharacterized protein with FMN-binding domain
MRRSIIGLFITAMAAFPIGSAWGSAHAATLRKAQAHAASSASRKYRGPSIDMQWGPVWVTVSIKGKKITNVTATAPMERARSNIINSQALPMLKQEVLQAQSSHVNTIGGATLTSEAYILSLHKALQKAKFSQT